MDDMIRLGLVDFDTSHVVEFTKRINHIDVDESQWVEGAKVVGGVPGQSKISPERIGPYAEAMRTYGVPLFDDPIDLIGKIDGVLIESVDGSVHLERARPFLERGIPTFVDKPFASSVADARAMADLAHRTHAPLFSSSSLRYAPELVAAKAELLSTVAILGADCHGPAPLDETGRNPGLFHYGIHAVEMLFTLLGRGCRQVTCSHSEMGEVVTGTWSNGAIGTVRGIRKGVAPYGFLAFGEKASQAVSVGTAFIYRELLKQIVMMMRSGTAPIDVQESVEIVAFMEAALKSRETMSQPVTIGT